MNNVENEIKSDYKKHIRKMLFEQSQKAQELYAWCQLNYGFWTQGVEPFDDVLKLKTEIDKLVKKYN